MYTSRNAPSLGFAFLPVIAGAIELGQKLLSSGSSGAGCTPPTDAFRLLLQKITPEEKADWIAYVRPLEARPTDWSGKIMGNDAAGLAWEYAGGDDCRTTSVNGKLIVAYTADLLATVQDRLAAANAGVPTRPDYTLPGIDVTVPRSSGTGLALGLGLLALVLLAPKRSARR